MFVNFTPVKVKFVVELYYTYQLYAHRSKLNFLIGCMFVNVCCLLGSREAGSCRMQIQLNVGSV